MSGMRATCVCVGGKKVVVHCSGKPERGASGMPEMPEINRAEFDQRPAGWSQFSRGWGGDGPGWISGLQATACHRNFCSPLADCLVSSRMEGRWPL